MRITSLSRQTDLIFARFNGKVIDRGHYTLVQTPDNPGHHWGNYIIFDSPPGAGDFKIWKQIYQKEFTYYDEMKHMTFTWDCTPLVPGDYQEFTMQGFEFNQGIALTTNKLTYPPKYNHDIVIKKITKDQEWQQVVLLQILCADPKFYNSGYETFKRRQISQYKAMNRQGLGDWYGAYIGDQLVGDLGIFFEGPLARFQNVGTHPKFRRRGVCQTLVYESAKMALEEYGVETLVMEADAEYHAAKIYESVGFTPSEKSFALSWWTSHD
jgi:ribosomal protein S18 acetylase RimI-like enzyme